MVILSEIMKDVLPIASEGRAFPLWVIQKRAIPLSPPRERVTQRKVRWQERVEAVGEANRKFLLGR